MAELPDYFPADRPHVPGSHELPSAASSPIPLTEYRWTPWTGWGMTVLTLLSIIVFGGGSAWVLTLDLQRDIVSVLAGVLLCTAYLVPLSVLWLASRRAGLSFGEMIGLRAAPWRPVVGLGVAIGVLGRLVAGVWGVAISLLGIDLPGEVNDPTSLLPPGVIGVVIVVFATSLLAPLAEEAIFRGALLSSLHDRWGRATAMAVSSVAFAAMHVLPVTIPPLFIFALMLSWVFIRSRTLWTAVIAHAVFNGIGLGMYFALNALVS